MNYKLLLPLLMLLSGCSTVAVNGTMCDKIASDPNETLPQECKNYEEAKANKAFHKVTEDKKVSHKDIEFDTDKNE